jgi:hypothetical protein
MVMSLSSLLLSLLLSLPSLASLVLVSLSVSLLSLSLVVLMQ